MVIAHHLMWTLYGWWLPNDPRGSTSTIVHTDLLKDLGELHHGRKRVQPPSRDIRAFYDQAGLRLKHDLLSFNPSEFSAVAESFNHAIRICGFTCYALAVMPDHVHLVIRKHRDRAEDMIEKLQALTREDIHRTSLRKPEHPVWTRGGYKVFLDSPDDVWRTIRYVENNPVKQRMPLQQWGFVVPYDNWPEHK